MQKRIQTGLFGFFLILTASCNSNSFDVDTSRIDLELNIKRLDKDILANYPDTPDVYQLMEQYGEFIDLYSKYVIQAGDPGHRDFVFFLMDFNRYCVEHYIPEKVDQVFGDFKTQKKDLEQAFKYYNYYFPDYSIPNVYTYLSNFSHSIVIDEGILAIGLDKYLGTDFAMYPGLGIDQYKIQKMHKAMLPVDCMRAIAESEFPFPDSANNMLNRIVHEGKIQYFLDAMLPFVPDTLKFGYSTHQYEWAEYNERKMWAYLIENKLLFSTDELTIRKMTGDGPFTTLFANNSAPRAGAFIGWKIVHRFMKKNPEIGLKELMTNNDFQGILNAAAYKP
jgi:hypothetical protein